MDKQENAKKKYVKNVKLEYETTVANLLGALAFQNVPFKQILFHLGYFYLQEGAVALTGLPIVTNKESVENLENGIICKFILDNWEKIKTQGYEHFKKTQGYYKQSEEVKNG